MNKYVESYVYEVIRRLPKNMRNSTKVDLENHILEMCKDEERNVIEVLTLLGDPSDFARKYNPKSMKIIGSDYMESFLAVLKSAIVCAVIISGLFAFLQSINGFTVNFYQGTTVSIALVKLFFMLLFKYSLISCFYVTILLIVVFSILQYRKNKKKKKETWNPKALKPINESYKKIDAPKCLFKIVVSCAIGGAIIISPRLWGAYFESKSTVHFIPLFNQESWNCVVFLVAAIVATVLLANSIELASGYYTKKVVSVLVILSIVRFVLFAYLLFIIPLFNLRFPQMIYDIKPELFRNGVEGPMTFMKEILPWVLIGIGVISWFIEFVPKLQIISSTHS